MILKRIVNDMGSIVGYQIDDGGMILNFPSRMLYHETYIEQIQSWGYTYTDYNPDKIVDPNGNKISELPESINLSEIPEMEWTDWVLASQSALTDAQCAKYYKAEALELIPMRKPIPLLKTRDELIMFLENERSLQDRRFTSLRGLPINSFTAPEALFTLDEIAKAENRKYLELAASRHVFNNYSEYQSCVKSLKDQGLLTSDNPTAFEFIKAYYAWGPELINAGVTFYDPNPKVDALVTEDSINLNDALAYMSNREHINALIDGNMVLHYLDKTTDISQTITATSLGRSDIALASDAFLMKVKALRFDTEFAPLDAYVKKEEPRVTFKLVSDTSYGAKYVATPSAAALTYDSSVDAIFSHYTPFLCTTPVGIRIPILGLSKDEFLAYSYAISIALNKKRERTKEPLYSQPIDILDEEGMSLETKIRYVGAHQNPSKDCSSDIYAMTTRDSAAIQASLYYNKPIPAGVLQAFKITETDEELTKEKFLEIADVDELLERRVSMANGAIDSSSEDWDPTYIPKASSEALRQKAFAMANNPIDDIDAIDYYKKILLVSDCLKGSAKFGMTIYGEQSDLDVTNQLNVVNLFMTIVYSKLGKNFTFDQAVQILNEVSENKYIASDSIFRLRDQTYWSNYYDRLLLANEKYGSDCTYWAVVTRIFTELSTSNENLRPYAIKTLCVKKGPRGKNIREDLTSLVYSAIKAAGLSTSPWTMSAEEALGTLSPMQAANMLAPKAAAYIFSQLLFAQAGQACNVDITSIISAVKEPVHIPPELVDRVKKYAQVFENYKYITVYDAAMYEFDYFAANGKFTFAFINAKVDFCEVTPKGGTIPATGLIANYYEQSAIDSIQPGLYDALVKGRRITEPALRYASEESLFTFYDNYYLQQELKTLPSLSAKEMQQRIIDNPCEQETIAAYVIRWSTTRKTLRDKGHKIWTIPMKQDLILPEFMQVFGHQPVTVTINDAASEDPREAGIIINNYNSMLLVDNEAIKNSRSYTTLFGKDSELVFKVLKLSLNVDDVTRVNTYLRSGHLIYVNERNQRFVLNLSQLSSENELMLQRLGILVRVGDATVIFYNTGAIVME